MERRSTQASSWESAGHYRSPISSLGAQRRAGTTGQSRERACPRLSHLGPPAGRPLGSRDGADRHARRSPPLVRRALADTFADAADAPRPLIVALANDQSEIAAVVLS